MQWRQRQRRPANALARSVISKSGAEPCRVELVVMAIAVLASHRQKPQDRRPRRRVTIAAPLTASSRSGNDPAGGRPCLTEALLHCATGGRDDIFAASFAFPTTLLSRKLTRRDVAAKPTAAFDHFIWPSNLAAPLPVFDIASSA